MKRLLATLVLLLTTACAAGTVGGGQTAFLPVEVENSSFRDWQVYAVSRNGHVEPLGRAVAASTTSFKLFRSAFSGGNVDIIVCENVRSNCREPQWGGVVTAQHKRIDITIGRRGNLLKFWPSGSSFPMQEAAAELNTAYEAFRGPDRYGAYVVTYGDQRLHRLPPQYAVWWQQVATCVEANGYKPARGLRQVEFWFVEDMWLLIPGLNQARHLAGYSPPGVLALDTEFAGVKPYVQHEMLHQLVPDFPDAPDRAHGDGTLFSACVSA